jgi:hypothetical protein
VDAADFDLAYLPELAELCERANVGAGHDPPCPAPGLPAAWGRIGLL